MTRYEGDQTVSVGEWFLTWIIMLIPVVNIVMMFVWAFGSNTKPSKANLFKFALIMIVICIVLLIVLGILGLTGVLDFDALEYWEYFIY